MASNALLVLAGAAQRRRSAVALNDLDLADHGDEIEWAMRPYFRKTARKKRSKNRHRIPLIGFAAAAARNLKRATNQPWLLPGRSERAEGADEDPHVDAG